MVMPPCIKALVRGRERVYFLVRDWVFPDIVIRVFIGRQYLAFSCCLELKAGLDVEAAEPGAAQAVAVGVVDLK